VYSEAIGRFVKLGSSDVATTGGSDQHSHTLSTTSGPYGGTTKNRGDNGSTACAVNHTHSLNHTHAAVANNSMPKSRCFMICKKA
jgi:hypothetical protein